MKPLQHRYATTWTASSQAAEVPTTALNTRRRDFDLGVSYATGRNNTPGNSRREVMLLI